MLTRYPMHIKNFCFPCSQCPHFALTFVYLLGLHLALYSHSVFLHINLSIKCLPFEGRFITAALWQTHSTLLVIS